ncbi:MAG: DUF4011 domain-containing protein [Cyclobacteriaceae bacterium]|nr:DUF4011 domain-containing protein [Cyclobacteriaceae bacterium]
MQPTSPLPVFLRRLTNLAGNSRLLYVPRAGTNYVDLQSLSFLAGQSAFNILEELIEGKVATICPVLDPRQEDANTSSRKLRSLQRTDTFIAEERGSRDLHLGWPFVHGSFADGTVVRCPLLLFPVTLTQHNQQWQLTLREGENIGFNKTFLLAYAHYNQTDVSENLLEEDFEDFEGDSTIFRTNIYQLLQSEKLAIHFNPDNYQNRLIPFEPVSKDQLAQYHGNGVLKLFPEALLGIFPQADSQLVPDYLDLMDKNAVPSLEEFFLTRTVVSEQPVTNFADRVREEKMFHTLTADDSQENIIKAVKSGYSVVVQGPPGSGKSQLICNLITDAIAQQKRVLVVCQKRAALDVIHERLTREGEADFLALVHDFRNDRKAIFAQIGQQISRVDEYKTRNNSLDAIQLDRNFLQISHAINQITDELEEFRQTLFDTSECGVSIKELYLNSNPQEPSISLTQEFNLYPPGEAHLFLNKLKAWCHYASRMEADDYLWRDRKSFSGLGITDRNAIQAILQAMPEQLAVSKSTTLQALGASVDVESCTVVAHHAEHLHAMLEWLADPAVYTSFRLLWNEPEEEANGLWLNNLERIMLDCFEGDGPETTLSADQLGPFQVALYRSMKTFRNPFGMLRWRLFSKDKYLLKRTLVANNLASTRPGFDQLEKRLDSRLNLEHNVSKLRTKSWLGTDPPYLDRAELRSWFLRLHRALDAKQVFDAIRNLRNFINPDNLSHAEFLEKVNILIDASVALDRQRLQWSQWLTQQQIYAVEQRPELAALLVQSLHDDFDALCVYDQLREGLSSEERNVLNKLHDAIGSWDHPALEKLFLNSLRIAWIDYLEAKHPVLRMVSSGSMEQKNAELRDLLERKRRLAHDIFLLRTREHMTEDMEYNRLNNRVTYRDLLHQVTKKKKLWPLRKLLSGYASDIFRVIPCWLTSPESVSALFPLENLFDLVIFDEASQCFAEKGIPAIYRGKQVVVAGDSKQLRPGDFYQVRWEESNQDDPDTEAESLLELASRYWMTLSLQGHYRSQSPELIAFSNQHFYQNKLHLLPTQSIMNGQQQPIQVYQTKGVWKNQSNIAEAEAVTNLVRELQQSELSPTIGVITFNAVQQALIHDMLDTAGISFERSQLFVKNIENVQGDERDVIIFSTGYAKDEKGKLSLQFGSLNVAGGENRLNVAITRARDRILIVTSLHHDQLPVDDTRNDGPKLLKAWLRYAHEVSDKKAPAAIATTADGISQGYLKKRVHEWATAKGFQLRLDCFPMADLVQISDKMYRHVLLTDDDHYFQSLSAKFSHSLHPALLEARGWKNKMFFSRACWIQEEKFLLEVEKFLQ